MNVVHADRAIAKKILQGDENAFRELFDSFFPRLYRFALVRLNGVRRKLRKDVGLRSARLVEKVRGFTRRALFNRSTTSRV